MYSILGKINLSKIIVFFPIFYIVSCLKINESKKDRDSDRRNITKDESVLNSLSNLPKNSHRRGLYMIGGQNCADSRMVLVNNACSAFCTLSNFLSGVTCVNPCPSGLSQNNICVSACIPPQVYIYLGVCSISCPANFYSPPQGGTCVSSTDVPANATIMGGFYCITNNVVSNNACVEACTNSYVVVGGYFCCPNANHYVQNNNCVLQCKNPTPYNTPTNMCVSSCTIYNGNACVTQCPSNMFLDGNTCRTSCSYPNYFYNGANCLSQCPATGNTIGQLNIISNMRNFTCGSTCTTANNVIQNGICFDYCSAPLLFYNQTDNTCYASCANLIDNLQCVNACLGTNVVINTNPKYCCPDPGMVILNNKCSNNCNAPYIYLLNGKCIDVCPASSPYLNGINCVTSCSAYIMNGVCVSSCYPFLTTFISGNTCVSSCPSTAPYLNNGNCVATCTGVNNYSIMKTFGTLSVKSCTNVCFGALFATSITPFVNTDNSCTNQCPSGYFVENGICASACSTANPNVIASFILVGTTMTSVNYCCATAGSLIQNYACVASCTANIVNDYISFQRANTCIDLSTYTAIRNSGDTTNSYIQNGIFVSACSSNYYQVIRSLGNDSPPYFCCPTGMVLDSMTYTCVPNCLWPNLYVNFNGYCLSTFCTQNTFTFVQSTQTLVCGCQTGFSFKTNKLCVQSCTGTSPYSYNGLCYSTCPSGYNPDAITFVCTNTGNYLYQGFWIKDCPSGTFKQPKTKSCVTNIISPFIMWNGLATDCSDLNSDYYLKFPVNGQCTNKCSSGFFYNPYSKSCESTCGYYNYFDGSNNICVNSCSGIFFPVNNSCCPGSSTYFSVNNNVCTIKAPGMVFSTLTQTYQPNCLDNEYLFGNSNACTTTCDKPFPYKDIEGKKCVSDCSTSSSSNNKNPLTIGSACISTSCTGAIFYVDGVNFCCPKGKYVEFNQCVSTCSIYNPYMNLDNQNCQPSCNGGLIYNKNNCVSTCPTEYTNIINNICCPATSQYTDNNLSCLDKCSSQFPYLIASSNKCVAACPTSSKLFLDTVSPYIPKCVDTCPSSFPFNYFGICMTSCLGFYINSIKDCLTTCPGNISDNQMNCIVTPTTTTYFLNTDSVKIYLPKCPANWFTYQDTFNCIKTCTDSNTNPLVLDPSTNICYPTSYACTGMTKLNNSYCCPTTSTAVMPYTNQWGIISVNCMTTCNIYPYLGISSTSSTCVITSGTNYFNSPNFTSSCTSPNTYIINGMCVSACPSNYFITGSQCTSTCSGYLIGNVCYTTCPTAFTNPTTGQKCVCNAITYNNTCLTQCPANTFIENKTCVGTCVGILIPNSSYCCPSTKMYIKDYVCVNMCNDTKPYLSAVGDFNCVASCPTYIANMTCVSTCPTNYPYLDGNTCKYICPNYLDLSTNKCVLSCKFYVGNLCYTACPAGTNFTQINQCVSSCLYPYNFYDSSNVCYNSCTASNKYLNSAGLCVSSCTAPTAFYQNFKCVSACSGTTPIENDTNCVAACTLPNYLLYNNKCYSSCPTAVPNNYNSVCIADCTVTSDKRYNQDNVCMTACTNPKPQSYNLICYATCPPPNYSTLIYSLNFICSASCAAPSLYSYYKTCVSVCPNDAQYVETINGILTCVIKCSVNYPYREPNSVFCIASCPNTYTATANNVCVTDCTQPAATGYPYLYTNFAGNYCIASCNSVGLFLQGTTCVTSCPKYFDNTNTCYENCPAFSYGTKCVASCSSIGLLTQVNQCVSKCTVLPFKNNLNCVSTCPVYTEGSNCVSSCSVNNPYIYTYTSNGVTINQCSSSCPINAPNSNNYVCTTACSGANIYLEGTTCVSTCSNNNPFIDGSNCVNVCSSSNPKISGSTCVSSCQAPNDFVEGNKCLSSCSSLNPFTKVVDGVKNCVNSCSFIKNSSCVNQCDSGEKVSGNLCITGTCSAPTQFNQNNTCVSSCSGTLPYANGINCVGNCTDYTLLMEGTQCVSSCSTLNPYLQYDRQTCNYTCPNFIQDNNCVTSCISPKNLTAGKLCVSQCTSTLPYLSGNNCVNACPNYYLGIQCVTSCPNLREGNNCVNACSASNPYNITNVCINGCPTNASLLWGSQCVATCPSPTIYNNSNVCVSQCGSPNNYIAGLTCVKACTSPLKFLNVSTFCVAKCDIYSELGQCTGNCSVNNPYLDGTDCVANCNPPFIQTFNQKMMCVPSCTAPDNFVNGMFCVPSCPNVNKYIYNGNLCKRPCLADNPYVLNNVCVAKCPSTGQMYNDTWICVSYCSTSFPFAYNFNCLQSCPSNAVYTKSYPAQNLTQCVQNCGTDMPYIYGTQCIAQCSSLNFFIYGITCVPSCPSVASYVDTTTGKCAIDCVSLKLLQEGMNCVNSCSTANPLILNGVCVPSCTTTFPLIIIATCSKACNSVLPYLNGIRCVNQCTLPNSYLENSNCVPLCSNANPYIYNSNTCVNTCPASQKYVSSGICVSDCSLKPNIYMYTLSSPPQCLPKCPNSYISTTLSCVKTCASPCATCNTYAYNCISCVPGYYLMSNSPTCVNVCPKGYILDTRSNMCVACGPECASCAVIGLCTKCSPTYLNVPYVTQGNCVASCPDGYFKLDANNCYKCRKECRTCTNLDTCTSCISGKYLIEDLSSCLNNCPSSGYWLDTTDSNGAICHKCTSPCKDCILSSTKCKNCINGMAYIPRSFKCAANCNDGEYLSNGNCLPCNQLCKTCKGPNNNDCLSCDPLFFKTIVNGKCNSGCLDVETFIKGNCVNIQKCINIFSINTPDTYDTSNPNFKISIKFEMNLILNCPTVSDFNLIWTNTYGGTVSANNQTVIIDCSTFVDVPISFELKLNYGTMLIQTISDTTYFKIFKLIPAITNANNLNTIEGSDLTVDASLSKDEAFDPNLGIDKELVFSWTCASNKKSFIADNCNSCTSSILKISKDDYSGVFQDDTTLDTLIILIQLNLSKGKKSAIINVKGKIINPEANGSQNSNVPKMTIKQTGLGDNNQPLQFEAQFLDPTQDVNSYSYVWTIGSLLPAQYLNGNSQNFVRVMVSSFVLGDNPLKLIAKKDTDTFNSQFIYTLKPPSGGTCSVSPNKGTYMQTTITFTANNWVTLNSPIKYRFLYLNDKNLKIDFSSGYIYVDTFTSNSIPVATAYYMEVTDFAGFQTTITCDLVIQPVVQNSIDPNSADAYKDPKVLLNFLAIAASGGKSVFIAFLKSQANMIKTLQRLGSDGKPLDQSLIDKLIDFLSSFSQDPTNANGPFSKEVKTLLDALLKFSTGMVTNVNKLNGFFGVANNMLLTKDVSKKSDNELYVKNMSDKINNSILPGQKISTRSASFDQKNKAISPTALSPIGVDDDSGGDDCAPNSQYCLSKEQMKKEMKKRKGKRIKGASKHTNDNKILPVRQDPFSDDSINGDLSGSEGNRILLSAPTQEYSFRLKLPQKLVNDSNQNATLNNTACIIYNSNHQPDSTSCLTFYDLDNWEAICQCTKIGLSVNVLDPGLSTLNKLAQFPDPGQVLTNPYSLSVVIFLFLCVIISIIIAYYKDNHDKNDKIWIKDKHYDTLQMYIIEYTKAGILNEYNFKNFYCFMIMYMHPVLIIFGVYNPYYSRNMRVLDFYLKIFLNVFFTVFPMTIIKNTSKADAMASRNPNIQDQINSLAMNAGQILQGIMVSVAAGLLTTIITTIFTMVIYEDVNDAEIKKKNRVIKRYIDCVLMGKEPSWKIKLRNACTKIYCFHYFEEMLLRLRETKIKEKEILNENKAQKLIKSQGSNEKKEIIEKVDENINSKQINEKIENSNEKPSNIINSNLKNNNENNSDQIFSLHAPIIEVNEIKRFSKSNLYSQMKPVSKDCKDIDVSNKKVDTEHEYDNSRRQLNCPVKADKSSLCLSSAQLILNKSNENISVFNENFGTHENQNVKIMNIYSDIDLVEQHIFEEWYLSGKEAIEHKGNITFKLACDLQFDERNFLFRYKDLLGDHHDYQIECIYVQIQPLIDSTELSSEQKKKNLLQNIKFITLVLFLLYLDYMIAGQIATIQSNYGSNSYKMWLLPLVSMLFTNFVVTANIMILINVFIMYKFGPLIYKGPNNLKKIIFNGLIPPDVQELHKTILDFRVIFGN